MNSNHKKLERLFSKARESEPVMSSDEIRGIISDTELVRDYVKNSKQFKGVKTMNLLTGAVAAAAIVSSVFLADLAKNDDQPLSNKISITKNTGNSDSEKNILTNKPKDINTADAKVYDDLAVNNNKDENSAENLADVEQINAVKTIKLSEKQIKDLGITIDKEGEYIEVYLSKIKPLKHKIYVDWGVGFNENELKDDNNKKLNIPVPQFISDNMGNRRITTIIDDDEHIVLSSINTTKNTNCALAEVFISDDTNILDNGKVNVDSIISKYAKFNWDGQLHIMSDSTLEYFDLSNLPKNQIVIDSVLNFCVNTTDSINPIFLNNPTYFDKDKNGIVVDNNKYFIKKFETDSANKFFIQKHTIQIPNSSINITDLNKDKNCNIDYNIQIINTDTKVKDSLIKNLNPKNLNANIRFIEGENININEIDKELEVIDKRLKIASEKLVNKLVPVEVPVPNAKDRNGKPMKDFKFILWFEPSEEFVKNLPNDISNQIKTELNLLEENGESCSNTDLTGGDKLLGVWQGCSGAIEDMRVFPNPTSGPIAIDLNLKEMRKLSISLHDLAGRKIKELAGNLNSSAGEFNRNYNIAGVEPGVYLIVVKSEQGEQAIQRVIVR